MKQCDDENDSKPFRLSDWTANLPKLAPNKKVGLIDSGIGKNDATGHGTVMNYIIHQICPETKPKKIMPLRNRVILASVTVFVMSFIPFYSIWMLGMFI